MSQRVVLGVGGGIAAYKVAHFLRLLTESGLDVRVVPTRAALNFVGKPTWEALSGHRVSAEVWDDVHDVPHVRIGREADLVIVAPATADLIAKAAHGLADDLLTNTLLTTRAPVIFAPAMHTEMWEHPATVENVAILRRRGIRVLDPGIGRLTGSDSGAGRLPEPEELARVVHRVLARRAAGVDVLADLEGRRVVVSAGGTREPIDPVRFVGNRSSGRQGYALAVTALARGAEVVLISANVSLPDPAGAKVVRVGTAEELRVAVLENSRDADAIVMAAAVADFRPSTYISTKIKKSGESTMGAATDIKLERTSDVVAELVARRRSSQGDSAQGDSAHGGGHEAAQIIVGFAAETGDAHGSVLDHGRAKLVAKGCDFMVINEVGIDRGFEKLDNKAVLVAADGTSVAIALTSKEDLADIVWDHVTARW